MNPVTARLLNQQLAAPQYSSPVQVVAHMGAMQAQEYRMMRWAVAMRTSRPSIEAFRKAYDSGAIMRQHLMRGTWQLITAIDRPWMMELFAPKAKAVITGWMKANRIDIPNDEQRHIRDIIIETAGSKSSVTEQDFARALMERDILMDKHRLSYHIRFNELLGVLTSGLLDDRKATYRLAPETANTIGRDESLALMARKYFQSRCPATFEDFVWWSGLGASDCRRGMELINQELHAEKWHGREFLIHESCRTHGFRKGSVLLVPPYDEYLIAYKSRDVVLPPEYSHKAHNNSGIFYPIVVHDGTVCGNWSPFRKTLQYSLFDGNAQLDLSREWDRYSSY